MQRADVEGGRGAGGGEGGGEGGGGAFTAGVMSLSALVIIRGRLPVHLNESIFGIPDCESVTLLYFRASARRCFFEVYYCFLLLNSQGVQLDKSDF